MNALTGYTEFAPGFSGLQNVSGPYSPLVDGPITPDNWQCLDGTLHVDEDGNQAAVHVNKK
ncbi:MAG: hypothetical protein WAM60_01730 [Candidatus Promineifilaceae bacterium]